MRPIFRGRRALVTFCFGLIHGFGFAGVLGELDLPAGQFAWASTATLLGTGLVTQEGENWVWNAAAFDANGELLRDYVTVQDPTNNNCGQCHGVTTGHHGVWLHQFERNLGCG